MKRSGTKVMLRLIGLVKPLTGWMILAILMGLAGHLCASGITVLGGYAVLELLQVHCGNRAGSCFCRCEHFCSAAWFAAVWGAVLQPLHCF